MGSAVTSGITDRQLAALRALAPWLSEDTYLAGGVAVAARYGHRLSRDLDFFRPALDAEATISRLTESGLNVEIVSRAEQTVYLEVDGVPASILGYAYPLLEPPVRLASLPVPVVAVSDLVGMKLSAVAGRGTKRDFWDLHVLLTQADQRLPDALALFQRKYTREDVGHVIRSLVYFGDADPEPMPEPLTGEQWESIKADFQSWVRALE